MQHRSKEGFEKTWAESGFGDRRSGGIGDNPLLSSRVLLKEGMAEGVEPPEEYEPGVLLKAKVHAVYAGTGQGKTWFALWVISRAIERGETVLYLDNENGYRIIAERLGELGVDPQLVDKHLYYLAFPSLTMQQESRRCYATLVKELRPDLVIFDSWITFLGAAGMDENSSNDIAEWCAAHTHQPRKQGATVVLLDHVPHDGSHARGSTRKKDEVDVQWSLRMTAHFDRETVGEISLLREKDREAWLPITVKFSVGGTLDGFLFERSSGTVDQTEPELKATAKEAVALDVLAGFGARGAKDAEWKEACVGKMSRAHYYRTKRGLIAQKRVAKDARGYHHVVRGPGGKNETKNETTKTSLFAGNSEDESHGVSSESHGQNETSQEKVSLVSSPFRDETNETWPPQREETTPPEPVDPALVEAALEAVRYGNGPRKVYENVCEGTQGLEDLARSITYYYGAKRFDGWEEWLAPVVEAFGALYAEQSEAEGEEADCAPARTV